MREIKNTVIYAAATAAILYSICFLMGNVC